MWKDVWKTYVSRNILMLAWNHLWLFKNSSNPITVQSKLAHYPSQVMSSVAIIVCDWFKIWQTILSIWKKLFLKFRSRIISPSSSLKPPSLWRLNGFFEDKEKHWGIFSSRWYYAFAFLISSSPFSYLSPKVGIYYVT